MADTILNLDTIETDYAVFEKDQVLTPGQLNSLSGYLDDQERLSRVALMGVGIACGLWPSLETNRVRLSHGVGTTTDGDLMYMPQATFYDRYKPYDSSAPKYPPFYSGSTMTTAYELVQEGESDSRAQALSGFESAEGRKLTAMAALLYVESYLQGQDLCTGTECDNLGKDWIHTTRLLLVDLKSAAALAGALDTPDRAARTPLNPVVITRALLQGSLATESDLSAVHRNAADTIYKSLAAALSVFYRPCQSFLQDLAPTDPWPRWQKALEVIRKSIPERGMQYYYDFMKDVAETYNAFRDALFGDTAVCCPDVEAFPKHLLLGSLDASLRASAPRTGFYPSPMVAERFEQRARARFLVRKLDTLITTFALPGTGDIRVTPSAFEDRSLEERAIPFYYTVRDDLPVYRAWSYRLSQRGMELYNYSYNAGRYGAVGGAAAPFRAQIGAFDFFRIEGHVGWNVGQAAQNLRNQIRQQNLPIDVETVLIGSDHTKVIFDPPFRNFDLYRFRHLLRTDVAAQLGEATDYGNKFAAQVADAVDKKIIANADAGQGVEVKGVAVNGSAAVATYAKQASDKLLSANYDMASKWQDDVFNAASAAAQMKQTLSPVTKNDFASPIDSIVAGPQTRWLTWIDTLIKDADDKEAARLMLAAYLAQNPGLEHYGGVLRGGTFVLVHDESQTVVADLMLPYRCCERRGEVLQPPVLQPLPKPPILIEKPIRIVALPDKFQFAQLQTDLVNQVQGKVDTQLGYFNTFKDTIDIIAGAKAGAAFVQPGGTMTATPGGTVTTPGGGIIMQPGLTVSDPILSMNIADTTWKGQKVDTLRAQLLDPGLDEKTRGTIENQLATAETELSTAIVATTDYVASSGLAVTVGTDGAKAMTTASAALAKVGNIDALASVEKGLNTVGGKTATSADMKAVIGNVLSARGMR